MGWEILKWREDSHVHHSTGAPWKVLQQNQCHTVVQIVRHFELSAGHLLFVILLRLTSGLVLPALPIER